MAYRDLGQDPRELRSRRANGIAATALLVAIVLVIAMLLIFA